MSGSLEAAREKARKKAAARRRRVTARAHARHEPLEECLRGLDACLLREKQWLRDLAKYSHCKLKRTELHDSDDDAAADRKLSELAKVMMEKARAARGLSGGGGALRHAKATIMRYEQREGKQFALRRVFNSMVLQRKLLGGEGLRAGSAGKANRPLFNRTAQEALGRAAAAGDAAAAREAVVEDGADANAAVFQGDGNLGGNCTSAYVAARHGHSGVLGVLLAVRADPNKGDTEYDHTPLHLACDQNDPDVVAVLLAHGADPNLANWSGLTPCMIAARSGWTACLRALVKGAEGQGVALDVNAVVTGGWANNMTALDFAVTRNREEAAAFLRDELGALRAAELPPPRKPPKSAAKIPGGARKRKRKLLGGKGHGAWLSQGSRKGRTKAQMEEAEERRQKDKKWNIRRGNLVGVKAFIEQGPRFLKLIIPEIILNALQEQLENASAIQLGKFQITSVERVSAKEAETWEWMGLRAGSAGKANRPLRFNVNTGGLLEAPSGSTIQFRVQQVLLGDYTKPTVSLTFNTRFVWEPTWDGIDASQTPPDVNVGNLKAHVVIVDQLYPPNPPGWWSTDSKKKVTNEGLQYFNVYVFDNDEMRGNPTLALLVETIPK